MNGRVKMSEWFKKRIMGYPSEEGEPPDRPKARRVNPETGRRVAGYLLNDSDLRVRSLAATVVKRADGLAYVRFYLANKRGKEIRELGEVVLATESTVTIAHLDHALFVHCS